MPLEVSEEQELNDIIIALTRLRLCRERFNSEIELREQGLYRRLSDIRSLGLENISYELLRFVARLPRWRAFLLIVGTEVAKVAVAFERQRLPSLNTYHSSHR